jgi:hypothetical protein
MAVVGPNSVSGVAPGRHGTGAAGACGASAESLGGARLRGDRVAEVLQWVGPTVFDNCGIADGAETRARSEVLPSGKRQSR